MIKRRCVNLVIRRGQIILVGIIWGREGRPSYGVEGWPQNRGLLCTILRQLGPRSVSAIGRVVAYQGWSLRGVPLYSNHVHEHKFLSVDYRLECSSTNQVQYGSAVLHILHIAKIGFIAISPPSWTVDVKSHCIRERIDIDLIEES